MLPGGDHLLWETIRGVETCEASSLPLPPLLLLMLLLRALLPLPVPVLPKEVGRPSMDATSGVTRSEVSLSIDETEVLGEKRDESDMCETAMGLVGDSATGGES